MKEKTEQTEQRWWWVGPNADEAEKTRNDEKSYENSRRNSIQSVIDRHGGWKKGVVDQERAIVRLFKVSRRFTLVRHAGAARGEWAGERDTFPHGPNSQIPHHTNISRGEMQAGMI